MKNVKNGHTHPIVCLDAGHYGKYNRSPAVPEFYESDMNWKLQNLLKAELEKYGIEVRLTRQEQSRDLALTARGAASEGCDAFESIHANAADNASADYTLGIYLVDDDCGQIDEQSKAFAKLMADKAAQVMGTTSRIWTRVSSQDRDGDGHKDDYYGVLRGAHSAGTMGIIMEHGFYTNKAQAQWLLKEENLQKLAVAKAEVYAQWFGVQKIEEKPKPKVSVTLPVIYPYDKNEHVEVMQALLIGYGYSCGPEGVDGSNGGATQKALKMYQADSELEVDGKCGPATWGSLLRQK